MNNLGSSAAAIYQSQITSDRYGFGLFQALLDLRYDHHLWIYKGGTKELLFSLPIFRQFIFKCLLQDWLLGSVWHPH